MKKINLVLLLTGLLLITNSVFSQVNQVTTDGLDGVWRKTQMLCRYFVKDEPTYYYGTIVDIDPRIFNVEVELRINTISNNGLKPERYVEKAVLQSSCKLNQTTMNADRDNKNPFIWSKNKVQIDYSSTGNGINHYSLKGILVDSNVNYKAINKCNGEFSEYQKFSFKTFAESFFLQNFGIQASVSTYMKYDFGGYFKKEANRDYEIYRIKNELFLEFNDKDICPHYDAKGVMTFIKEK